MALSFPRTDLFSGIAFTDQKFQLVERQELSRQANGITRGKSFGSPIWRADWTTQPMLHDDALDFEAILNSLDGVLQTFQAYDLRRPFPRADPDGSILTSGPSLTLDFIQDIGLIVTGNATIGSIGSNQKSMTLNGLPGRYVLSRGDYLAFDYGTGPSRALHQIMETVTVTSAGNCPTFEVRPHFRPGIALNAIVSLRRPSGIFRLDPGSISQSTQGLMTTLSFSAFQDL